jgi:hypothetical protein
MTFSGTFRDWLARTKMPVLAHVSVPGSPLRSRRDRSSVLGAGRSSMNKGRGRFLRLELRRAPEAYGRFGENNA